MYLLNLAADLSRTDLARFTFHYVSIKSATGENSEASKKHLHSTMYLLNLPERRGNHRGDFIYIPLCIY